MVDLPIPSFLQAFPPLHSSVESVVQLVKLQLQRGAARVHVVCEMLGTEEIAEALHRYLGLPLYLAPPAFAAYGTAAKAGDISSTFKTRGLHAERLRELQFLLPEVSPSQHL